MSDPSTISALRVVEVLKMTRQRFNAVEFHQLLDQPVAHLNVHDRAICLGIAWSVFIDACKTLGISRNSPAYKKGLSELKQHFISGLQSLNPMRVLAQGRVNLNLVRGHQRTSKSLKSSSIPKRSRVRVRRSLPR